LVGELNSGASYNIALGNQALKCNTGDNNIALGYLTLCSNTTGTDNTAIGARALCANTTGCNNTATGRFAGRYLVDGATALTSPDNSTYLGTCTRGYAATDSNVTVIGYCTCACGDNTVSIGNGDVTDTYINGCTSVVGDISASGNGYFTCVIAGGYFEDKVASPKLAQYPTGSIVVIGKDGNLELATRENDTRVFGVTQKGAPQPIVLGAEPVLVTGNVKVGDFITTSTKPGHGKRSMHTIHGTVIAQSMDEGSGDSHLIKAMIRKM